MALRLIDFLNSSRDGLTLYFTESDPSECDGEDWNDIGDEFAHVYDEFISEVWQVRFPSDAVIYDVFSSCTVFPSKRQLVQGYAPAFVVGYINNSMRLPYKLISYDALALDSCCLRVYIGDRFSDVKSDTERLGALWTRIGDDSQTLAADNGETMENFS